MLEKLSYVFEKVFLEPIREQQLLSKKDIETIFGNLETIRGVNETLKNDLEKVWSTATA